VNIKKEYVRAEHELGFLVFTVVDLLETLDLFGSVLLDLVGSLTGSRVAGQEINSQKVAGSLPHVILPAQKVLLERAIVITLATLANAGSTEGLEFLVNATADRVVVFVGLVTEAKHDKVEMAQGLVGILVVPNREFGNVLTRDEELPKVDSVIGGFTLTVGGEDKDGKVIGRQGVEKVHVVVFQVGGHGLEVIALGSLLGEAGSIVFSGSSLRSIEKDNGLVL
jgi:hypothetical protein